MARNSEKQYGRLNRLLLAKEKEEYEKNNPKRPKLNSLDTVEEIKKWLPGIKQDMNFYLKKSQVICYSDEHIEECKQKIVHLEKEYKAFVRKISQLTSGTLDAVPWTNRPYKRKCLDSVEQPSAKKEFTPILTPILDQEPKLQEITTIPVDCLPLMDQPLTFICDDKKNEHSLKNQEITSIPVDNLPLMDQPLTFVCDDQKTEQSAITSTSSNTSLKSSVCEISLNNYLKTPYLDNQVSKNPSLSVVQQPLIFESNCLIRANSKELNCDISFKTSECEHSNHAKTSCSLVETKGSLVSYASSSDSES